MTERSWTAVNRARGEAVVVIDGTPRRLCLTLGALAEIEAGLGLATPADLPQRLRRLSAEDLLGVLAALLRGGGENLDVAALRASDLTPRVAAEAIGAAFEAGADG
jgi:hypothetical protein